MKALVPNLFRTGGIVDGEDVNDNLRAIADDVNRNLSRRYTYCTVAIPLDGMTNAMTAAERTINFNPPVNGGGFARTVSVVETKLSIYATAGVTWTLSGTSLTNSISLTTAGATTEATAVSSQVMEANSSSAFSFTLAGSAASTIARGTLYLTIRSDRFAQPSTDATPYTPTYVDASSSSAGSVLDTQLTAAATAVTNDAAAAEDLRCECFLARNFSTDQVWTMPSGAGRTAAGVRGYIVATAADAVDVKDQGGTLFSLTGTGTSNTVSGSGTQANRSDGPTSTANDTVVTISPTVGTIELCYVFFWWS